MRLGPVFGVLLLSLIGHMSIARWLEDHSTWMHRNRRATRVVFFVIALFGPFFRTLSVYLGLGQNAAPYALVEVTLAVFAGSTVGIMKTFFWLYGKLSGKLHEHLAKAAHSANNEKRGERERTSGADRGELAGGTPSLADSEVSPTPIGTTSPDRREREGGTPSLVDSEVSPTPIGTTSPDRGEREGGTPSQAAPTESWVPAFREQEEKRISRRLLLERALGTSLLATSTGAIGWGIVRGRHAFRIDEVVVKIPGLSPKLDGYTIAQVSDVHVGTFVTERELEEGFSLVRSMKPDLIVATGDLVDHDPAYCDLFAGTLAKLPSRDGTYCIYGNHDYTTGAGFVADALARAKVPLLVNDARVIRAAEGGFSLVGMDEVWGRWWGRRGPDLDRALAGAPGDLPRILLSHQPKTFRDFAGKCALQLSGHTHGGQINPGFRPADLVFEYVAGRYERNGSTLWVNRGFGVAGPPSRVGAPPEITKIVLVSG